METLLQPEELTCAKCRLLVDIFDWMLWAEAGKEFTEFTPDDIVCPDCLIAAKTDPDAQRKLRQRFLLHRNVRVDVGEPPGTLHVISMEVYKSGAQGRESTKIYPAWIYGVSVDAGAFASYRRRVIFPKMPSHDPQWVGLILALTLSPDDSEPPAWYLHFLWQYPEVDAACELLDWRTAPVTLASAERLMAVLGVLRDFAVPGPGRRKGTNKRSRAWYFERIREHARAIRKEPTEEEFCKRYNVPRKTLRRNLAREGLWPWEEFLRRGLGSSRAHTVKV